MSKRRKGFHSETCVKRGLRVVGAGKELVEKLGRADPCPCGSGRSFPALLLTSGRYDGAERNHYFQGLNRPPLRHARRRPQWREGG